jgi:hypothetical protein
MILAQPVPCVVDSARAVTEGGLADDITKPQFGQWA